MSLTDRFPLGVIISLGRDGLTGLDRAKEIGLPTVQLLVEHSEIVQPDTTQTLRATLAETNIIVSAVFCCFQGEDYATIGETRNTVGLVPEETRGGRIQETKSIADLARDLGVDVVGMHIGFIPEESGDPNYAIMVQVAQDICGHCARNGQRFHLETGQETAETLLKFIADVDRPNLAVNFDPANMILYGSGEPLDALRKVGTHIKSVHAKDAIPSDTPGREWGQETPLGEGAVNISAFVETLIKIGYEGPITIERESPGEQRWVDIQYGADLLRKVVTQLGQE